MPLPKTTYPNFARLARTYAEAKVEFPHLRAVTLAQWALECGWGGTGLAQDHRNYGGAKWRKYMEPYASPVWYIAHDGREMYCKFPTDDKWIAGYWARLDLEPAYKGWREHTASAEAFISFIGPTWVGGTPADGKRYIKHVLTIVSANDLNALFEDTHAPTSDTSVHGGSSPWDRMLPDRKPAGRKGGAEKG